MTTPQHVVASLDPKESPPSLLYSLPNEVVQLIFDYLGDRPLLPLDKHLIDFSRSNFYRTVSIKSYKQLARFSSAVIGNPMLGRHVQHLEIAITPSCSPRLSWRHDIGPRPAPPGFSTFPQALQLLVNLQSFNLECYAVLLYGILNSRISWAPNLQELRIDAPLPFFDHVLGWPQFVKFANKPTLKTLSLTGTDMWTDPIWQSNDREEEEEEEEHSSFFPALRDLRLDGGFSSPRTFADVLSKLSLTNLEVRPDKLTDESFPSFLGPAHSPIRLTHLTITGAHSGSSLTSLHHFTSLESLTLKFFTSRCPIEFYDSLRQLPLRKIVIGDGFRERVDPYLVTLLERKSIETIEVVEVNSYKFEMGHNIHMMFNGMLYEGESEEIPGVASDTGEGTDELDWVEELRVVLRKAGMEAAGTAFECYEMRQRWIEALAIARETMWRTFPDTEDNRKSLFRYKTPDPTKVYLDNYLLQDDDWEEY